MHHRVHGAGGAVRPVREILPRRAGEVRYSFESLLSHVTRETSFGSFVLSEGCSWLAVSIRGYDNLNRGLSTKVRVLRYACGPTSSDGNPAGNPSSNPETLSTPGRCRSAGTSLQLLQDRASVTASFPERKPGCSLDIHRAVLSGRSHIRWHLFRQSYLLSKAAWNYRKGLVGSAGLEPATSCV